MDQKKTETGPMTRVRNDRGGASLGTEGGRILPADAADAGWVPGPGSHTHTAAEPAGRHWACALEQSLGAVATEAGAPRSPRSAVRGAMATDACAPPERSPAHCT